MIMMGIFWKDVAKVASQLLCILAEKHYQASFKLKITLIMGLVKPSFLTSYSNPPPVFINCSGLMMTA
jgi:hypothetical protein